MWLSPIIGRSKLRGDNRPRIQFAIPAFLAILLLMVILSLAYTGFFSRYLADDYCFSRQVIENGFWGGQVHSFNTWSDRFSTMFVTSLIDKLGVPGIQALPTVLLLGLLVGMFLLIRRLGNIFKVQMTGLEQFILGGLVTFGTFYTAPSLFQSLYWRAGSVTYTLPLMLIPFLILLLLSWMQEKPNALWVLAVGLCFGLAGGFSETNLAFQAALLVVLGVLMGWKGCSLTNKKSLWAGLIAGLVGSLIALVVMALAPGNAVRMDSMHKAPDLLKSILLSFRYAAGFLYQTASGYPLPFGILAVLGFALAIRVDWKAAEPKQWAWLLWAVPLGVTLVIAAACLPSAYIQGAYPENRALISARWIFTAGWMFEFYALGVVYIHWRSRSPKYDLRKTTANVSFVIVMCCFYLVFCSLQVLSNIPAEQKRATAWDERALQIAALKQSGQTDIQVTALDSVEKIKEISDDPTHWVNKCAAVYYGVETIKAK